MMLVVFALMIAITVSEAVPCGQRLDVISIYAWPLLSRVFDPDLLMEAKLVAIQRSIYNTWAILHTDCQTYLSESTDIFNQNGSSAPLELEELRGHVVQDVKIAEEFVGILTADGAVWMIGRDDSVTQNTTGLHLVEGFPPVQAFALGKYHAVVLTQNAQTVLTWGDSRYLGHPGNGTHPAAVQGIPTGETVTKIVCGDWHMLALSSSGILYGWGENWYGQLLNAPDGAPYATQLDVGDNRVLDVVAANGRTVARTDADMKCFGNSIFTPGHGNYLPWFIEMPSTLVFARDIMAIPSLYADEDTMGSVQLWCTANRRERCEDGSSEE